VEKKKIEEARETHLQQEKTVNDKIKIVNSKRAE